MLEDVQRGVFEKFCKIMVDALGVDEDKVTLDDTMVAGLGAESIDDLDIAFRVEQRFGIEVRRSELYPDDILTNTDYVVRGRVNAAGIAALKKRMPFANLERFEAKPLAADFNNYLTVGDYCRYVQRKIPSDS